MDTSSCDLKYELWLELHEMQQRSFVVHYIPHTILDLLYVGGALAANTMLCNAFREGINICHVESADFVPLDLLPVKRFVFS